MNEPSACKADEDDTAAEDCDFKGITPAWHIQQVRTVIAGNEEDGKGDQTAIENGMGDIAHHEQGNQRHDTDNHIRNKLPERGAKVVPEWVFLFVAVEFVDIVLA